MDRIIILGCPGAGKSVFARQLHEKTGIPLIYLDTLYYRPDGTHIPEERFDAELQAIMTAPRWILDGHYQRTIPARLAQCDTVLLMDYPPEICLAGVESRLGKAREDMPWLETEFDPVFRNCISHFPEEKMPQVYAWLGAYPGKELHIFPSRADADAFLRSL